MNRVVNTVIAVAAVMAIAVAVWMLSAGAAGLRVTHHRVGDTPVTVYGPPDRTPSPAVLVAHGFAGSATLMQAYAMTLAHSGYRAVAFDFLGHGRHPRPLTGNLLEAAGATRRLVAQTARVADFARGMPGSDGRLAVLGHSMASDIVVRYAQGRPDVAATVAISPYAPTIEPGSPANLLMIVGGFEGSLRREALRVLAKGLETAPEAGVTYGDWTADTARRLVIADGVEHVGVLYSRTALMAARDWLNRAFGRTEPGRITSLGPCIALLLLGVVLLARPLARWLPVVPDAAPFARIGGRRFLALAVAPAVITPLLLWPLPTDFLPTMVVDYLVLHFALYGALTSLGLWLACGRRGIVPPGAAVLTRLTIAIVAALAYGLGVVGVVVDTWVTNFMPIAARVPLVLAAMAGALPYFVADEWLTRRPGVPRGAYALTKLAFLASLGAAVALDLESLFFLIVIVPVIAVVFVIYGLFSRWIDRQTGSPLVAGVTNALVFGWALGVTFPLLAGA